MDANHDGVLQPDEVPPERRGMLQFFASRLGVDASQPIPISRIRDAVSSRSTPSNPSSPPASTTTDNTQEKAKANQPGKPEQPPLVPGFGVEEVLPPVAAFGERVPGDPATLASMSSPTAAVDDRTRAFVDERFRRYDRNQSGMLEKEEWGEMRGDPNAMDRNRDGRLTREEYTAGVAEYMRSRSGGGSGGSRGGGFGGGPSGPPSDSQAAGVASKSESESRKSYRFVSPTERLPEGLPSWFSQRDRNGDAQVAMAEYSSFWSPESAREFARYDINGDGIVTPQECLKAATGAVAPDSGSDMGTSDSSAGSPAKSSSGSGGSGSSDSTPWWMR